MSVHRLFTRTVFGSWKSHVCVDYITHKGLKKVEQNIVDRSVYSYKYNTGGKVKKWLQLVIHTINMHTEQKARHGDKTSLI